jgi:secreted trypsin-like serine protease
VREEKVLAHALAIQVAQLDLKFSTYLLAYSLGGGFFVKIGSSWTLRGIVSVTLLKDNTDCDINRFSVYTKVVEFYGWIKGITEQTTPT